MGLYDGEEIVTYVTPDGRSLPVPQSVANQLQAQGLGTGPVPFAPGLPGGPNAAGGTVEPAPASVVDSLYDLANKQTVVPQQPDYYLPPEVAAPIQAADAAATQAYDRANPPAKVSKKPAAPRNTLADAGIEGGLNTELAALEAQKAAGLRAAEVAAAGKTVLADAQRDRSVEITAAEKVRTDIAEKNISEADAKRALIVKTRDQIANTKIDRSYDHPVMAAIALVLGGIGSALKRDSVNPAIEMLWKSVDRKVAGQMADLEQKGKVLGMTRDELIDLKEKFGTTMGVQNTLVAAAAEKGARYIEELTSRTSSDEIRANGLQMAAAMRLRGAEKTMAAIQAELDLGEKRANRAAENSRFYSSLKQNDIHFSKELLFKYDNLLSDEQKAMWSAKASGSASAAKATADLMKENEARGIGDARGKYLLTQKGYDMSDQADKMVAEAKELRAGGVLTAEQTTKADTLEQQARQLKEMANTAEVYRQGDAGIANKTAQKVAAIQTVAKLTDDIKNLYDQKGRVYLSTDAGQKEIQSKQGLLLMFLKDAFHLGVLSKQDITQVDRVTGGDATKGFTTGNISDLLGGIKIGEDPEAFKAALTAVSETLESGLTSELRASHWDVDASTPAGKKRLRMIYHQEEAPLDPGAVTSKKDLTPAEAASDRRSAGTISDTISRVLYPLSGSAKSQADALENSGSVTRPGLSKNQAEVFDTWMAARAKGGDEGKKAEASLSQQVLSDRPALALATLHNLRDTDLKLYNELKTKVPSDSVVGKQLAYEDQRRDAAAAGRGTAEPVDPLARLKRSGVAAETARAAVMANTGITDLGKLAIIGDKPALAELGRRAGAGGPDAADARKMLDAAVKNREKLSGGGYR